MSAKEVRFAFDKQPGSLEIRLLEMQQNSVRIDMLPEHAGIAAQATSDLFQKLIARDAATFPSILLKLSGFTITLLTDPISDVTSLEILNVNDSFSIKINKLKTETAALFFKALPPASKPAGTVVSPSPVLKVEEDDEFSDALTVEEDLKTSTPLTDVATETEDVFFDLQPDDEELATQKLTTNPPSASIASPLPSREIASMKPLTEEKTSLDQIKENFNKIFSSMEVHRGAGQKEPFAPIFLERFFGKIESCTFDPKTNEFTLFLTAEQKRKLLGPFSLHIRKQVKGKFDFEKGRISFEHGCTTLDWGWTSGYLHSIGKNPQNGQLTIGGKFLGITSDSDFSVDNFVTMLEYNVT